MNLNLQEKCDPHLGHLQLPTPPLFLIDLSIHPFHTILFGFCFNVLAHLEHLAHKSVIQGPYYFTGI